MKSRQKWILAVICLVFVTMGVVSVISRVRNFLEKDRDDGRISISVIEEESKPEETTEREKDQEETGRGWDESFWGETSESDPETEETEEDSGLTDPDNSPAERRSGWKYQVPSPLPVESLPEEETLPTIWLLSDLHYMSAASTDYGSAFEEFVKKSDGKIVRYLPELLDTVLEEAEREKPDALILTGDITMNGERINHLELAEKLTRVQDSGIQILVIPGNHDINNQKAGIYFGETAERTREISPEEYGEIYGELGPGQALSRDEASFSYVYALRDKIWLVLLDTARYDPVNYVEGEVKQETCIWLEENLAAAKKQGIQVLVLGHHNLLQESRVYTSQCVMDNSQELTELLERYQVPLYISGHLHVQRVKKHKKEPGDTGYGIYEIVSDAVSIPPCQYGVVSWQENGTIDYKTRAADVSSWAERNGIDNDDLLNFAEYQRSYVHDLIREKVKKNIKDIPEEIADSMGLYYAGLYADYCAGIRIDRLEAEYEKAYREWERFMPDSREMDEIRAMIRDSVEDSNRFIFSEEREDEEDGMPR